MNLKTADRSFDRGAWLLLAGVVAFVALVLVNTIAVLRLPGDGWQIDYNDRDQGIHRLIYFMGDWTTPLRVGDRVTAVNGEPLSEAVQMTPMALPAGWKEGGTVTYTVLRQGNQLTVPVALHRLDPAGIGRGLANTMRAEVAQWSWFFVGLIVFFLRPKNRAARLLLAAGTGFAIVTKFGWASTAISLDFAPLLTWLFNWIAGFFWGWLFFPSLILLLLSFPLPQWPLTRFPRLVPALFYATPLAVTAYTLLTGRLDLATVLLVLEAVLIFGAAVAAVVQAFRHRKNRVVRAQVSWLALGIAVSIGGTLLAYLLEYSGLVGTIGENGLWAVLSWPVTLALPVCLAIAILRYRLFDISVIIRRTLVYAVLTGLLALVYFGSVVLLQTIFDTVARERSPLIIVVSTLLIAALFAPLRRRVQGFIDRRFYRRKYDAQQILKRFARTARDEVAMEELTGELLTMIQEIVEPEQLSLWLSDGRRDK